MRQIGSANGSPNSAVDTQCSPKRVLDTYSPDQSAQLRANLRPPAKRARLPTPVATKAGPMPTDERLGTDDRDDLQHRRKPSIQLDQEQAIAVGEADGVLCLKTALRLQRRNEQR